MSLWPDRRLHDPLTAVGRVCFDELSIQILTPHPEGGVLTRKLTGFIFQQMRVEHIWPAGQVKSGRPSMKPAIRKDVHGAERLHRSNSRDDCG